MPFVSINSSGTDSKEYIRAQAQRPAAKTDIAVNLIIARREPAHFAHPWLAFQFRNFLLAECIHVRAANRALQHGNIANVFGYHQVVFAYKTIPRRKNRPHIGIKLDAEQHDGQAHQIRHRKPDQLCFADVLAKVSTSTDFS